MIRGDRPAPEKYRGVELPEGMARGCLDEVARLINRHQWEDNEDSDAECAVKVFAVVRAHLR